jgi:outer membrane lipoprotein-sorting protein
MLLLLSSMSLVQAQDNELGWTMDSAIKQLDRQGDDLKTVLAQVKIEWSGSEKNLNRIKHGRIYINKDGDFRIAGEAPDKRVLLLEGRKLHTYDPALSQVTEINLRRDKKRLERFIPVGFTVTGRDLKDDYLVTFLGEGEIGDRRTLKLELTPKRDEIRAVVSKIEIWFDQASWLPVRQRISQTASAETITLNYTRTARNLNLNPDLFRDRWPKGTEKIRQ